MYTVEILVCKKVRDRVGIFYGIVLQIQTEQGVVWAECLWLAVPATHLPTHIIIIA